MLVFLDESGDTGRKLDYGSSRYFVVASVMFESNEEALACDQRISLLRKELGLSSDYEFHFGRNSDKVRCLFLEAIEPYNFTFSAVAINKDPKKLYGPGFEIKESFYKYAVNMVFTNLKPFLNKAIVVIDRSGNPDFRNRLAKYLRIKHKSEADKTYIKRFKQEESSSNNLLQVADYVSGVLNRKVQKKKNWEKFYKFLSTKELGFQIWPK